MNTTTPDVTLLTAEQRRAASPLVYGLSNKVIGAETYLSETTVASHLSALRERLGVPGSSRPVLVHTLLTRRLVARPQARQACPAFTSEELQLVRAIAEHSLNADIGRVIGVRGEDVRTEIDAVVAKGRADNTTHLVGLAHTWGLFDQAGSEAQA